MRTPRILACWLGTGLISYSVAATVVMDFNDAAAGTLSGQSGLGTGAGGTWAGSTSIDVFGGDLSADPATNYAITQGGTAQSVKHEGNFGTQARKATVALDSALTGSTIWGSFLVNQNGHADGRGGIAFNQGDVSAGAGPANPRIFLIADNFQAWLSGTAEVDLADVSNDTFDNTLLVLFKVDYDPAGAETTSFWLDPDVTALGVADATTTSDWLGAGGITSLTVFSYTAEAADEPAGGPLVDSVRLSDDADGYLQVTGVIPEPSTALAALLGGIALLRRRR